MPKIKAQKNEQAAIDQWIDGFFCLIDHLNQHHQTALDALHDKVGFETLKAYTIIVVEPVPLGSATERNRKALERWSKAVLKNEFADEKLSIDFVIKPASRIGCFMGFAGAWMRQAIRAIQYKLTGHEAHFSAWVEQLSRFFDSPINLIGVAREHEGDHQVIDDYKSKYVLFVKV